MYEYIQIYIYIYIYTCLYMYTYLYKYLYIHIYTHIFIYMSFRACVCVSNYIYAPLSLARYLFPPRTLRSLFLCLSLLLHLSSSLLSRSLYICLSLSLSHARSQDCFSRPKIEKKLLKQIEKKLLKQISSNEISTDLKYCFLVNYWFLWSGSMNPPLQSSVN